MVPTEEMRHEFPSAIADLRDVPLAELTAVDPDLLCKTVARVLPDPSANPVPVAAFQSAI